MLKHTIRYTDYNGQPAEEVAYFNINREEMMTFSINYPGALDILSNEAFRSSDQAFLYNFSKDLIKLAYGVRSADGKRFMKRPEHLLELVETGAFNALLMELLTDEEGTKLVEFFKSVAPEEFLEKQGS